MWQQRWREVGLGREGGGRVFTLPAGSQSCGKKKKKKNRLWSDTLRNHPKVPDTCISSVAASSEVVGESFFFFSPLLPRVHCEWASERVSLVCVSWTIKAMIVLPGAAWTTVQGPERIEFIKTNYCLRRLIFGWSFRGSVTTQYPPHHVRGGTQLFKNQTTCSGPEKFFRSNCSGKSGAALWGMGLVRKWAGPPCV